MGSDDAYADAVSWCSDAVLDISGCDRAHILGYCVRGGLVTAATVSHLEWRSAGSEQS